MVMDFERFQFGEPGDSRVAMHIIEEKPPVDLGIALFMFNPMIRSENADGMAALAEGFGDQLATQIERPSMVRWIEVRQDENFHRTSLP